MAKGDPGIGPDGRPLEQRRGWFGQPVGRLLILPALVYAIAVTQVPFLLTVYYSFQQWNLQRPNRRGFAGFDNYRFILTRDDDFWAALANTVVFTVGTVLLALVVGMFYAELVNRRFPGRGIVRTLLITPFLVMPAASALVWKNMMLNPIFGVVGWLTRTGLPGDISTNFLGRYPDWSLVGVLTWRWAPFMMLILLAGMQSIDEQIREAARVDGATGWQEFRDITLPHLSRFIQLGGLLGTVYIVQEFDAIYLMTSGGPGNASTNLSYLVYQRAVAGSNVGLGAALGVIVVLISIVVITFLLRSLDRLMRE